MKLLILLSLAAICWAGHGKIDRKGFLFPGQPKSGKGLNTFAWSEYGSIGSLNLEKSNRAAKTSEDSGPSGPVLSNPNRRDVKIGRGFPGFGFHGPLKQVPSDDIKNKAQPSFIENPTPELKKEKSSSSEESQASDDKPGKSSSAESSESSSLSSSEETNVPNPNEEAPNNSNISAPADNQTDASEKEEPEPSVENDKSKVFDKIEEPPMKLTFMPFVAAKGLGHPNRIRDVDTKRPEAAKRTRALGHRPLRSVDFNIGDFGIKLKNEGGRNVLGPQGGIEKKQQQKRVRRPAKQ
ncbi:uncharacterized protein [Engystomops pustulosus]|uniref:uncharacterized protein n=1 Tax=Engystomops pustulosus TaxID=76066 RepID=UPI003AFA03CC